MIDPKQDDLRLRQMPLLDLGEEAEKSLPEEANRVSEMARLALEEVGKGDSFHNQPRWFEDYLRLREAGWPWRVACYIAWASSPRKDRYPKTQEELASKILGLTSDRQITTWRKRNPVIDETISMLQAAPLIAHRRDIYEALIESASRPDYKGHNDRKLALELMGDYVQRKDLRVKGSLSGKDVTQRSDAELRAMLGGEEVEEGESPEVAADDEEVGF